MEMSGLRLGRMGALMSFRLACCGVRPPLRELQLVQAHTRFSQVSGPFWVLVGAQMAAVLIEIGYITHPTEAKRLFNPNYQKLLAEGIANGIESYIYHNGMDWRYNQDHRI